MKKRILSKIAIVALLGMGSLNAQAQTVVYQWAGELLGGTATYTNGDSWSVDGVTPADAVPDAGDFALVNDFGQATLTISNVITQIPGTIGIGWDTPGTTGRVDVVAGGGITTALLRLGHSTGGSPNHGELNMSGGTLIATSFDLGEGGGSGTVNLTGTSLLHVGFLDFEIGTIFIANSATFMINGDHVSNGDASNWVANAFIAPLNAGDSIGYQFNGSQTRFTIVPPGVVVFLDDFNGGGGAWGDLGVNLTNRQSSGLVMSTWSIPSVGGLGELDSSVGLTDQMLTRVDGDIGVSNGTAFLTLDTDFGTILFGQEWELSFSQRRTGTGLGNGWNGFSVDSGEAINTPFASGFGFIMTGLGHWTVFTNGVEVGGGSLGYAGAHVWYDVKATMDEVAGTVSINYIDGPSGTLNLGTFPTSFSGSGRFVGFRNHVGSMGVGLVADMYTEDITIRIPDAVVEIGDIATELIPGGLALTWDTQAWGTYSLQSRSNLVFDSWADTAHTNILGTGGGVTVTTTVSGAESFYRVTGE